jgi:predicted secreted protein
MIKRGWVYVLMLGFGIYTCLGWGSVLPVSESFMLTKTHPGYVVQLDSNPTTGYSWQVEAYDPALITIKKHEYIAPKRSIAGEGGHELWWFVATPVALEKVPQKTIIKMIYVRPWEWKRGVKVPEFNVRRFKVYISQ